MEENNDKEEIKFCPECGDILSESDSDKLQDEELTKFCEDIARGFTDNAFSQIWRDEKEELKEMNRKDLCQEMFFRGAVMMLYSYIKENEGFDQGELWDDGGFIKKVNPEDMQVKMRTFSMGHDEEMNFECKNCKIKISAHSHDWHESLCDKCFETEFNDGEVHVEAN
jgi:hypothetical protein